MFRVFCAINTVNTSISSLQSLVANKQDKLTFDTTPTSGSSNPITSGAVYTAINKLGGVTRTTVTYPEFASGASRGDMWLCNYEDSRYVKAYIGVVCYGSYFPAFGYLHNGTKSGTVVFVSGTEARGKMWGVTNANMDSTVDLTNASGTWIHFN